MAEQGFVAEVDSRPVAYLTACGTDRSRVASHKDLELPEEFFRGNDGDQPVLMSAQLDWSATEKDSGATLFSKFNVVTTIDYTVRSNGKSPWVDEFRVNWPPVAGMTLKALLGRTRQTFFVPDESLLAASFNAIGAQAVLDAGVGLIDEDNEAGIISSLGGSDVCLLLLPGRGFFPIPDVVTQCRLSDRGDFEEAMSARIRKLNRKARKKDRLPPWKTAEIRGLHRLYSYGVRSIQRHDTARFHAFGFVRPHGYGRQGSRASLPDRGRDQHRSRGFCEALA